MPALRQPCHSTGKPLGVRLVRRFWSSLLLAPGRKSQADPGKNQSQQVEFLATVSDRTRPEAKKSSATEDTV